MHSRAHRATVLAVVTVLLVATALAGCGSNNANDSSTSGAATPAPSSKGSASGSGGAAVTGAPVTVGNMCSCSGPDAASNALIGETMQIWQKWTNAHGGINGHPVKVIVADDGGDPAKALKNAKKLVEQDHVIAIVGQQTNQTSAFRKYVERQGVPVVGGGPYDVAMMTSPDFFPSGGTLAAANYGLVAEAQKQGKKKLSLMVCAEAPICGLYINAFGNLTKSLGGSMVYSAKIAGSQPNYTANCLASKQAGADALFVESFSPVVARVHGNCAQQGHIPSQFGIASTIDLTSTRPTTVTQYNLSLADTKTPTGKALQDAIDQYGPKDFRTRPAYTANVMQAWIGAELFRAAGDAAKLTPGSTPADAKRGLYALKDETVGGAAPPLNFVQGKPTVISCWFTETHVKTKITAYDDKPSCVPPDQVGDLYRWFKAG
jgi:branched-chain amino acid transport system substrate-binding protein